MKKIAADKIRELNEKLSKFRTSFSEQGVWNSIRRFAKKIGMKTTYTVLLLFYAYKREETPAWAKRIVIGSLGYFVTLFDAIPDLTPFIGFTDDIGILSFGLVAIAAYIDEGVRATAKQKLNDWFGNIDEQMLKQIDEKL